MSRKPIETENQNGYFACEGCRDERSMEEQDLRVDADGTCWCDDCYTEDHTWEEWKALKKFVPKFRQELNRKDAEIARLQAALKRCRWWFDESISVDEIVLSGKDVSCAGMRRMCADALGESE